MYHLESRCLTTPMYWCITDQCEHWPSRCRSRSRKIGFLTEVSIHLRCHGILLTYRDIAISKSHKMPANMWVISSTASSWWWIVNWWWRRHHTWCHFSKAILWVQVGTDDFPFLHDAGMGPRTCHLSRVCDCCGSAWTLCHVGNASSPKRWWYWSRYWIHQELPQVEPSWQSHSHSCTKRSGSSGGKALMFQGHSEIPHDFLRVWNQRDPLEWKLHEARKKTSYFPWNPGCWN